MNKKLTKLLSVFVIAGTIGMGSVMSFAGCGHTHTAGSEWQSDETSHWHECTAGDGEQLDKEEHVDPDGDGVCNVCGANIVMISTVEATANKTEVTVGEKITLSASITGAGSFNEDVTWAITEGSDKATLSDNVLTTTKEGTIKVQATAVGDASVKSNVITITVANTITTAYTGPAAGPQGGTQNVELGFKGSDLEAGTLSAPWTDGTFTIVSASEIRNRKDTTNVYTRSVKNGVITVEAPAGAKLEIVYSSGSSTIGNASYKLTKPDGTSETVTINAADKVLQTLTIESTQAGTYKFETGGGTVDTWECSLSYTSSATAIQSIDITSAGLTDYLVTQKLDCTGVSIVAIDSNNVPHAVDLINCKFDTSKYNPAVAGEYEIGVTYYLDSNLDSDKTEFTSSYKVKVYQVESISLYTMSYASNKQTSLQQACVTGDTFNSDNLTVMAKCKLGNDTIDYKLKDGWYTVYAPNDFSTPGTKYAIVSVGTDYTVGNKPVETAYEIVVKDKKDVVDNKVEITVGSNGEFSTLTQAVQYLKACNYSSSVNKVIKLEAGEYVEKVWLDVDNVTLIGQGDTMDDTVITYSAVEDTVDLATGNKFVLSCATVHVTGNNFKSYNLSIRNDFDYINEASKYGSPQGLALTIAGDGAVLYNTHLYGNQDTLYLKSRAYFYQSQIDGNVDFIFGEATGLAFFEDCKIVAISRAATDKGTDQNGHVTAMKGDSKTKPDYGVIFSGCKFTDDGKVADGAMSLGRPWGANATVAYINCSFSAAYATSAYGTNKTDRWCAMSGNLPENADFCEYGSTGDGAITEAVTGGRILTAEQAANYTKANIFAATNGLQSSTAWDCDTELTKLKILAGEIPEETTKTVDLTDTSLTNGNCVADINSMYGEILTWTGSGSFETIKPTNGVKVGTDTVITLKITGEVTVVPGYYLSASDYTITYSGGKATITINAISGQYGDFIGSIVIDTTKTPADTVA